MAPRIGRWGRFVLAAAVSWGCWGACGSPARANIIVDYTADAGGTNANPLNGLSAQASFRLVGTELTIVLTNTSSGVPMGAEVSDSLLVSLAFNLGDCTIVSGNSALIDAGSVGLGNWNGLSAGDNVGDEWLWTNDNGGDLLSAFTQVISTSDGQGGGSTTSFNGVSDPNVDGPFGGIASSPPQLAVPANQHAVSDAIVFKLTLSRTLSFSELQSIAQGSWVEFGSDWQYLSVPAPAGAPLLAVAALVGRRRRRRR